MANSSWQTRRVTIKDIARAADVDPSTVTRALQDSPRVKPATREKIAALAHEMGYVPNMAARTLVNRRSGLVGVVIPDLTNPFFRDLAKGIEDEAAKHDFRTVMNDTRGVESAEREAVNLFLELKVDGLIVPM
ncbi:MAG: LacI family DNA-binding transcriptional regulator, partial [Pseudomonadota bacterium]